MFMFFENRMVVLICMPVKKITDDKTCIHEGCHNGLRAFNGS